MKWAMPCAVPPTAGGPPLRRPRGLALATVNTHGVCTGTEFTVLLSRTNPPSLGTHGHWGHIHDDSRGHTYTPDLPSRSPSEVRSHGRRVRLRTLRGAARLGQLLLLESNLVEDRASLTGLARSRPQQYTRVSYTTVKPTVAAFSSFSAFFCHQMPFWSATHRAHPNTRGASVALRRAVQLVD
jgi:hypothetical protein